MEKTNLKKGEIIDASLMSVKELREFYKGQMRFNLFLDDNCSFIFCYFFAGAGSMPGGLAPTGLNNPPAKRKWDE